MCSWQHCHWSCESSRSFLNLSFINAPLLPKELQPDPQPVSLEGSQINIHKEFEDEDMIIRHMLPFVFYKCTPRPNELEADPQRLSLEGS